MIRIEGNRNALYQWDLNQRIILTDIVAGTQVHFSNDETVKENCPVVLAYEDKGSVYANIPNIFLQKSGIITVYIYAKGEDEAHTEHHAEILVLARPKPADYIYTETEVLTVEQAVEIALQEAKDSGEFDGPPGPPGPPGDGTNSDLRVEVTIGQDGKLVADHTIQQIKAAHLSGRTVSAVYEDTENDFTCIMPLTMISESTVTFDLITDISTFTVSRLRIQDDSVYITSECADMQYLLNGGIDPYVHTNYVKSMIKDAISALPNLDEVSY